MFLLDPEIKRDPVRRWNLPDDIFFGHGACHILAAAFLERYPHGGFHPIWIQPAPGFHGNHVFVTDGDTAFDYRGYSEYDRLVADHCESYQSEFAGWSAQLIRVRGDLCDPQAMAAIGMHVRGPKEYLHDAMPRARAFLQMFAPPGAAPIVGRSELP